MGKETTDYMQHIIKVDSEVRFLNTLDEWIGNNTVGWDAWMFSKIDESLDDVHIPYYDTDKNDYRRFLPDFVFWMCKGNEYRIVFVDPKGGVHTNAYDKIAGYQNIFEEKHNEALPRKFSYGKRWNVSVNLLMFNLKKAPLRGYERYWTRQPGDIFRCGDPQYSDP